MTYTYNILGLKRLAAVDRQGRYGHAVVIGKNVAIGRIERTQCWGDKKWKVARRWC